MVALCNRETIYIFMLFLLLLLLFSSFCIIYILFQSFTVCCCSVFWLPNCKKPPFSSMALKKKQKKWGKTKLKDNKFQLSLTNPRDALHHGERAANKCDKLATELSWQQFMSKDANFQLLHLHLTYPACIWRLHWGRPHLSFAVIFGRRKLESLGYHVSLFAWAYV